MSYSTLYTNYVTLKNKNSGKENISCEETEQVTTQVPPKYHSSTTQVEGQEQIKILAFCSEPKSGKEIMDEMAMQIENIFSTTI